MCAVCRRSRPSARRDRIVRHRFTRRQAELQRRAIDRVVHLHSRIRTERAEALGDKAWTTALDAHNRVVDEHVASARGAVIKFTGDGALAMFDWGAGARDQLRVRDPRRGARPRA